MMELEWPVPDANFHKVLGGEIIEIINNNDIECKCQYQNVEKFQHGNA